MCVCLCVVVVLLMHYYLPKKIKDTVCVFRYTLSCPYCNTARYLSREEILGSAQTSGQHQHDVCEKHNMQLLVCGLEGCQCNIVFRSLLIHAINIPSLFFFFFVDWEGQQIYSIVRNLYPRLDLNLKWVWTKSEGLFFPPIHSF